MQYKKLILYSAVYAKVGDVSVGENALNEFLLKPFCIELRVLSASV
jgi:hypothetical protein